MHGQRAPHVRLSEDLPEAAPNLAPPPGNPRFPLFDSLRAIAALSVFLGHTITGTYAPARHHDLFYLAVQVANQGVAIFFLISGFLLYRPFLVARRAGSRLSVRDFARRRVLRIVPAYWVALSLFILAGLVSGVTSHNWWIFYGFAQIYSTSTIGNGIGAAWTLCIEVTFYAALPIFALTAARLGRGRASLRGDIALLVILSAASLAFRAHFSAFSSYATVSTLAGTFFWFALGMGLAVASVAQEERFASSRLTSSVVERPGMFWAAAAMASILLYEVYRAPGTAAYFVSAHVLHGLVAFLVLIPGVFGDTAGGLPRRVLRLPVLSWIGLVSYAFYLYHSIVIAQINKLVTNQHLSQRYLVVLVASFLLTCICSAGSYYVVERPLMRLRILPIRRRPRPGAPRGRPSAAVNDVARPSSKEPAVDCQLDATTARSGNSGPWHAD